MKRAVVSIGLLLCALVTPAGAVEWKVQTLFTTGTILYDEFAKMADKVNRLLADASASRRSP